jgi:hypothetical protein
MSNRKTSTKKAPKKGAVLEIFFIPTKPRCYADCGGDVDEYVYAYGALKGTLKVHWAGQQKTGVEYLVHFFGLQVSQEFSALDPKEVTPLLERALKEAAFDLDRALQLRLL